MIQVMRIADGGDGETVRLEGKAQILELGGDGYVDEDALATSGFEAMREGGPAQAGQRSLYHDMYMQHQQQQQQQHQQQQQQQQEMSDKAVSANLLRPDAAASKFQQIATAAAAAAAQSTTEAAAGTTTNARHPNPTLEFATQASTESAFDSEEKNVQTDWSTIGKVGRKEGSVRSYTK